VAELAARDALGGLGLPLAVGAAALEALPAAALTSVAPFRGQEAAVAAALGAALPGPGETAEVAGGRILWTGIGQWFVQGSAVPDLTGRAAVTDQSDAWAGLRLVGADAAEVLARLVPLDLDSVAFPAGRAARTPLRHVACVLIATGKGYDILVMRSFARTAVEDLAEAMRLLAGRAALGKAARTRGRVLVADQPALSK
jgi:sarcosine oxidase subunit gamma